MNFQCFLVVGRARRPRLGPLSLAKFSVLAMLSVAMTGCTGLRAPNLDSLASKTSSGVTELLVGQQERTSYLNPDGTVLAAGTGGSGSRNQSEKVYYATRQALRQNAIVLHIPADENPIRVLPLPEDGQTVYVNQLIRQSRVAEALGRVDVKLFRHHPETINGLPLDCRVAKDGKTVQPECDYSLRAGDRIEVRRPEGLNLVNTLLLR